MKRETSGIDTLRKAVNYFNNTNETFNQKYEAHELLKLYEMYRASGWDFTPDQWATWQVADALDRCIVPTWDGDERPSGKCDECGTYCTSVRDSECLCDTCDSDIIEEWRANGRPA